MKFLPGVTTTENSDWKSKIAEIAELGIEEIAVFPTFLDKEKRSEFYLELEKSSIKKIPFVHLRDDMENWEIEYFIKKFNAVVFNCHFSRINPINPEWEKYKDIICIENHGGFDEEELRNYGGICLDLAHMENDIMLGRVSQEEYQRVLKKYPIKCNHISAIREKVQMTNGEMSYDWHKLEDITELNYLEKYPMEYFSNQCAIELENSLKKQLEVIEYIKVLFSDRDELIKRIF